MKNSLSLFSSKKFAPLFISQFFAAFNDNLYRTALAGFVTYVVTSLSDMEKGVTVTIALGLFILPFFLFSSLAGEIADKFEKAILIRKLKFIEIFVVALGSVGFIIGSIYLMLFVLFLMGVLATFFGPIKYSILPDHLKENELLAGNGFIEAGTFLAILFGTIVGGLLATHQVTATYVIAPMVFIVALISYISSRFIPKTNYGIENVTFKSLAANKPDFNIVRGSKRIIASAKENRRVFLSILGISWFWLLGGLILSQMPLYAKNILNSDENVLTFLLTCFSLGIGIGSALANIILKGQISSKFVPISALLMSLFLWDLSAIDYSYFNLPQMLDFFGFITSFTGLHVSFSLLMFAICGGVFIVPLYALMQNLSESKNRSSVVAANNIINAFFMVCSSIVFAILTALGLKIPGMFFILAILNLGVAIYICKLLPETIIRRVFIIVFKILFRVEVKGVENYYNSANRKIIIANHSSFLDAALLAVFLPEKVTFAVNLFIAKLPFIKPFLSIVRAFPIDPTNPMATKSLIEEVKRNGQIVIFPEGRITVTGSLMKIYPGPGMIADKTGADILPIKIENAQFTYFSRLKALHKLRLFPKIKIEILPAQKLHIDPSLKSRKRRDEAARQLYKIMSDMMFKASNYQTNLYAALIDAAKKYGPNHDIVNDVNRRALNYRELILRSNILGDYLRKNLRNSNPHIGLLLPNVNGLVVSFFAMQLAGKIPAMLNFSSGAKNLISACHTSQIKEIITSSKFVEKAKLENVMEALKAEDINIIYLEELAGKISRFLKLVNLFSITFLPLRDKIKIDANSPAVILFTSGSEGTPKAVMLSHSNLIANCNQVISRVDFNPSDKVFNAMPMFHSFGLTGGTILPLLSGVSIFLYPSPLHYRLVPELIYDTRSTIMFGTDTFLAGYAKYAHPYDFFAMRYIFAGAEKLKPETRRLWSDKFGVRIFEGYGATETSPVISVNSPMYNKPSTVGQILPSIEYRLEQVPGITGGKLIVKGPNIMLGYMLADNPGKLVPPVNDEYDTGDIVTIDEEGYVTICGRVKRFAKIAGEMVSLTAVEVEISKLWPEYLHAVIAIPDSKKGEQLVLVTTKRDAKRTEIASYFKQAGVSEISVPKRIEIIDNLPLLATGKIDYVTITKRVLD